MEESRTQLGEKADGLYPVYWSEGDAIAVNGVISTPLAAEAAGQPSATFQVNGDVAYPYCVVYPASAAATVEEGEGEGEVTEPAPVTAYPVTFANVQPYTVGTFAPQSAPMYAYTVEAAEGEEQLPIQMQHLTGVLRLAVKGDITLASMTVAAEGKIAGLHTVDCTSGVLTADESATNNITVVLPEGGLKLNADVATPIYVAVPAGEHGIYTITLVSDALVDNTMVVRFNSDFHPVVAGVVKEFGEVTFTPNANNGEEGELVIVNAAQMKRLAQLSEVGQLSNVTKVTVGATIDMSEVANWHGIELLPSHITFDGGSDKGYEIKGLKAPLFGATAATVQNVKLTDVAIVETEQPIVGAIARRFDGTMTNCEAHGTLEVNNTSFTTTANMDKYDVINIGGLVGQAGGATISNCENRVAVTVKSVCGEDTTPYIAVGGAVGGAHSGVSLTEVKNYGAITIDTGEKSLRVHAAGIVGRMIWYSTDVATAPDVKVVTKCENHGTITTTAETTGLASSVYAGIAAVITRGITNFSYNHNYGALTCNDASGSRNVGGIVGSHSWSPIDNCTNNAPITNNGAAGATRLGGIIAGDVLLAITNCTNNAEGVIKNSGILSNKNNLYAGGIAAGDLTIASEDYAAYELKAENCHITNCTNNADIIHAGVCYSIFLGGINARQTTASFSNCTNNGNVKHIGNSKGNLNVAGINGRNCGAIDNCTNTGAIVVGDGTNAPETAGDLTACGISYISTGPVTNCNNTGHITVDRDENGATNKVTLRVAGIVSEVSNRISDCSNSGNISVSDVSAYGNTVFIAGIAGKTYVTTNSSSTQKWQNLTNSGNITLNNVGGWTGNSSCHIGGLIAYCTASGSGFTTEDRVELYNCNNSGNITGTNIVPGLASETSGKEGRTIIGGCFGYHHITYYDWNNCDNEGDINLDIKASSHSFVAGLAGFVAQNAGILVATCTMQHCDNSGDVVVTVSKPTNQGTAAGEGLIVGGIYAEWYLATSTAKQEVHMEHLSNSGAITLQGDYIAVGDSRHCVAGISADHYAYGTFTDCRNSGAITVDGSLNGTGKDDAKRLLVGGIVAYIHQHNNTYDGTPNTDLYYCTNTGNVTVKNLDMKDYICIGGVMGYMPNQTVNTVISGCGNSGTVTVDNVAGASGKTFNVGGVFGNYAETSTTFRGENVNIGNVCVTNCAPDMTKAYIGGFVGCTKEPIVGAKSYCDIEALGLTGTVGMIVGMARADATKATNSGVGGSIAIDFTEVPEDEYGGSDATIKVPIKKTLDSSNWFEHIYSTAVTKAVAEGDKCSLLTEKPALPTYTPAAQ